MKNRNTNEKKRKKNIESFLFLDKFKKNSADIFSCFIAIYLFVYENQLVP